MRWNDDYLYTSDNSVYKSAYAGMTRDGTMSGTIGSATISGWSGSSSAVHSGTWSVWSY